MFVTIEEEKAFVVALDPATGEERWREPTTFGSRIRGVEHGIITDDDTAYFLQATGGQLDIAARSDVRPQLRDAVRTDLVAIRTSTGEERWRQAIRGTADPSGGTCGDTVCFRIDEGERELVRYDRATGDEVGRGRATGPGTGGNDATVAMDDTGRFLYASRGTVNLTQVSGWGVTQDWSVDVETLFEEPVTPDGGWAGFPVADGGWVAWLGPSIPRSQRENPVPGTRFSLGAIAGFGDDGTRRWSIADRMMCPPLIASSGDGDDSHDVDQVWLCVGEAMVDGPEQGRLLATEITAVDARTGAQIWNLPLDDGFDMLDTTSTVLRIDDSRFLIDTGRGLFVLDRTRAPEPTEDRSVQGWCEPEVVRDEVDGEKYLRAMIPHPCTLDGRAVETPALPVPDFAGSVVGGSSIWVTEDGTIRGTPNTP